MAVDTKEYLKHLRTTHFTLVIVCVAILIAGTIQPPRKYEIALRHTRQISEAVKGWNGIELSHATAKSIAERSFGSDAPSDLIHFAIQLNPASAAINVTPFSGVFAATPESMLVVRNYDERNYPTTFAGTYLSNSAGELDTEIKNEIKTLRDFQQVWDLFYQLQQYNIVREIRAADAIVPALNNKNERLNLVATGVGEFIHHPSLGGPHMGEKFLHLLQDKRNLKYDVKPISQVPWLNDFTEELKGATYVLLSSYNIGWSGVPVAVPAIMTTVPIDPQGVFISENPAAKGWFKGKFSYSFSELSDAAGDQDNLEFEKIIKILNDEAERASGRISVLGVEFPRSLLSTWGMLAILAIQLYFIAHRDAYFRSNAVAADPPDIPWIGAYKDGISKAIYILSVAALPASVSIWFYLSEGRYEDGLVWLLSSAVTILILANSARLTLQILSE